MILDLVNHKIHQSKRISELLENIQYSVAKLESFNIYKNIGIDLYPGLNSNDVKVKFNFKEKSSYFGSASHYIDKSGKNKRKLDIFY